MSGKWSVLVRDPSLVRPAAMCVTDVLSVLEEGDPRRISEYSLDDGACLGRRSMDDLLSKSAYVHIFSDRDHFPDGKRGFYLVGVREILRIR